MWLHPRQLLEIIVAGCYKEGIHMEDYRRMGTGLEVVLGSEVKIGGIVVLGLVA